MEDDLAVHEPKDKLAYSWEEESWPLCEDISNMVLD